jgi:hypothetical protein
MAIKDNPGSPRSQNGKEDTVTVAVRREGEISGS